MPQPQPRARDEDRDKRQRRKEHQPPLPAPPPGLRPPQGNRRLRRLLVPGRRLHYGAQFCTFLRQIA